MSHFAGARPASFCAALALGPLAGCSDEPPREERTWYRDVLPIVEENCVACHTRGGVAPFAMDRDPSDPDAYADIESAAESIVAVVEDGHMPPWPPDPACKSYVAERRLDGDELETLRLWFEQGAKPGDPALAPPPLPPSELERVDSTLALEPAYTPASPEFRDVQCFVLDPALEATAYLVGVRFLPGSPRARNAVIYRAARAVAQAADAADPALGFDCLSGSLEGASAIGSWLPGAAPVLYPTASGVELAPDSVLLLQIHYDLAGGLAEPDQSGLELMLATEPPARPALLSMVAEDEFVIPAMTRDVTARATAPLPAALAIRGIAPQLGLRGTRIRLDVTRAGENECLIDIPRYDYGWQELYFVADAGGVRVGAGEALELTCTWDNASEADVGAGAGADDERCAAHVFATAP